MTRFIRTPSQLLKSIFRRRLKKTVTVSHLKVEPLEDRVTPNIDFSGGFYSSPFLSLNGGATLNGTRLQLTNGVGGLATSYFTFGKESTDAFSTSFTFQMTNAQADGMMFVLQNSNPTATGLPGSGLGYGMLNSVGIKFDLYDSVGEGSNTTGLYVNGAFPTNPGSIGLGGVSLYGNIIQVSITYDGAVLHVDTYDTNTFQHSVQDYGIDLFSVLGGHTAWAGFTASTGGLAATIEVLDWTYTASTPIYSISGGYSLASSEGQSTGSGNSYVAVFHSRSATTNPAEYHGTIDWGDGQITTAPIVYDGGDQFHVQDDHAYQNPGVYNIVTTVNFGFGMNVTTTSTASITDGDLTDVGRSLVSGFAVVSPATYAFAFTDSDPNGTTADLYIQSANWGDGSTSTAGMTIIPGSSIFGNTFTFSAAHQYALVGTYPYTIVVASTGGKTVTFTGTLSQQDPILTTGTSASITGVEGTTASLSNATFTQAFTGAPANDFSIVSVDWGDGSTNASGLSILGGGGSFIVSGSHLYTRKGTYPIQITVSYHGGLKVGTITGTATIADAVLTPGAPSAGTGGVEGLSNAVLTSTLFTDGNIYDLASDFYIASVNWGDGNTSAVGLTITGSNGTFQVNGSHLYPSAGSYNYSIVVGETGGSQITLAGTTLVGDAPITNVNNVSFVPYVNVPFSGVVASFTDTDPKAINTPGNYTATITWGDGSSSPGTIISAGSPNSYYVTAGGTHHTYTQMGLQAGNVTVTVHHEGLNHSTSPTPILVGESIVVGGLIFAVTNQFAHSGTVSSSSADVLVGFVPQPGQAFVPVLRLSGDTAIDSSSGQIQNTGSVVSLVGGTTTLLNNGFPIGTLISQLTGAGVTGLSGASIVVQDKVFTPSTIAIEFNSGSPRVLMDGTLTLPNGLISPDNHVVIDALGVALADVGGSVAGTFVVGGVTIDRTNLTLAINGTGTGFTLTGVTSITVSGLGTSVYTVSGNIINGELADLTLVLASPISLSYAGCALSTSSTNPLTLNYLASSGEFTLSGGATINVPGLGSAIQVAMTGTVTTGQVKSIRMIVATNASMSVSGFTISSSVTTPLTLDYSSITNEIVITGGATLTIPGFGTVDVTAVGTISSGLLQSLTLTAATNAAITVAGVTITSSSAAPLIFTYDRPGSRFTISGSATVNVSGLGSSILTTASGLISANTLQSLTLTLASSVSISVGSVQLSTSAANPIVFAYVSASNTLTISGAAKINVPGFGNGIDVNATGVIGAGGLQSFDLTLATNTTLAVMGVQVTPMISNPLHFSYVALGNKFTISGGATITIQQFGSPIDLLASGTIQGGVLTNLDLTAATSMTFTVAGFTLTTSSANPFKLSYQPGSIALSGAATLSLPYTTGSTDVSISGSVLNNRLRQFDLTVTSSAVFTIGGLTIAPSSLILRMNLDSLQFAVSGAATVTFPTIGLLNVNLSGLMFNNLLTNFRMITTNFPTFTLEGVSITPMALQFQFDALTGYSLSGQVTIDVPHFGAFPALISGTILNGVLTNFSASINLSTTTLNLDGVRITPGLFTFSYAVNVGATLLGLAIANFPTFGAIAVTFSATSFQNAFQDFTLTATPINARINLPGGVILDPKGMIFSYSSSIGYTLSGLTDIIVPTFGTMHVTVGGTIHGTLQSLSFTATATNIAFGIAAVTITPHSFTLSYNAPDSYSISGVADVTIPSFGTFATTLSGIFRNAQLQYITFTTIATGSPGFTFNGVTLTPDAMSLTYTRPSRLSLTGSAFVSAASPITVNTQVTIGANFVAGQLQSIFMTVDPVPSNHLSLTLGTAPNSPRLDGSITGPLTFIFTSSTGELFITGDFSHLANGTISLTNFPGLTSTGNLPVQFSFGVNSSGLVTRATVLLTGTLSIHTGNVGQIDITITNPSIDYNGTLRDVSLSASSASVQIANQFGNAGPTTIVWNGGTLVAARTRNANLSLSIPSVASLQLTDFTFDYQPLNNLFLVGGTIAVNVPAFNFSYSVTIPLHDFSNLTLASWNYAPTISTSFAGMSVSASNLTVAFGLSLIGGSYQPSISFNADRVTASIPALGSTFQARLGSSSLPGLKFTPQSNLPVEMNLLDVNGIFGVPNLAYITLTNFNLAYRFSPTAPVVDLWGSSSVVIPALGQTRITATFGNASSPGIHLVNGSLESLNITISQGSTITIGKFLTVTAATPLTVLYSKANGTLEVNGTVTGTLAFFGTAGDMVIALGSPGNPGLLITGSQLSQINATAQGVINVQGLVFNSPSISVRYRSGGNLTLWGSGTGRIGSFANISFDLGNQSSPGLVINSLGRVVSMYGTFHGSITIGPLSLSGDLGVLYREQVIFGVTIPSYALSGGMSASAGGIGFTASNITGTVTILGTVTGLGFTVNSGISLYGVTLGGVSLTGSISTQTVSLTGHANFSLPSSVPSAVSSILNGLLGGVSVSVSITPGNLAESSVGFTTGFSIMGSSYTGGITVRGDGSLKYTPQALDDLAHGNIFGFLGGVFGGFFSSIGNAVGSIFSSIFGGPIAGATIFYTTGTNLTPLPGDPTATTAADGSYQLVYPAGGTGRLVMFGGVDQSTGLPNTQIFTSMSDAIVLSPLTTLVDLVSRDHSYALGDANAIVTQALNMPSSLQLPFQNIVQMALAGDMDAAQAFATEVKLYSLVSEITGLLHGLSGAPSEVMIGYEVYKAIAAKLVQFTGQFDFSDNTTLTALINDVATTLGLTVSPSLTSGAVSIMQEVSSTINAIPVAVTQSYLNQVVQAQIVAQGAITSDLTQAAVGTLSIATVVSTHTGSSLASQISAAVVGQLNLSPPVISMTPIVSSEVGAGETNVFQYTVYLIEGSPHTQTVEVHYATEDSTAIAANGDYTPVSGTLSWAPGDTAPKTITVNVGIGSVLAAAKLFKIVLSNPVHGLLASGGAVGNIVASNFASTTSLTTSGTTFTFGDSITLTATVTIQDGSSTPGSGSVTFYDGIVALGTSSLVNGVAQLTLTDLPGGPHSITAVYDGRSIPGAQYLSSTSVSAAVTITGASQTITFAPLADRIYGAEAFTLTATASSGIPVGFQITGPGVLDGDLLIITGAGSITITAIQPGNTDYAAAPNVSYTFTVHPAVLTFNVDDAGANFGQSHPSFTGTYNGFVNNEDISVVTIAPVFNIAPTLAAAGNYAIVASGGVATNYTIQYVNGTFHYGREASQIGLNLSTTSAVHGETVTFTATVTSSPTAGVPTGQVEFFANGISLGLSTITVGVASLTWNGGSIGDNIITAAYLGDSNHTANATPSQTLTVAKASTVIVIGTSAGPSAGSTTVTITVQAVGPGSGTPTGSLEFRHGSVVITTYQLVNGMASITVPTGVAGQLSYTYSGDDNFVTSSITGTLGSGQQVTVAVTTSLIGAAEFGKSLTLTAAVTPVLAGPSATGTVEFLDGSTVIGTANVVAGVATLTTLLDVGTRQITAHFIGLDGFEALAAFEEVLVDPSAPVLTLTVSSGVYNGSAYTASATIAGILDGVDDTPGSTLGGGGLVLDYQLYDTNGTLLAILGSTAPTNAGIYLVTVHYAGSANYAALDVSAPFVISRATATITVTGYNGVYDANTHYATGSATGVLSEDLSAALDLSHGFRNAPGGTAHWIFNGNTNYLPASGDVAIVITQATATISVFGFTGNYDGNIHHATGTVLGVDGSDLSAFMDFGAGFSDAPGGTVDWTFTGNENYLAASGQVVISIAPIAANVVVSGYNGVYDGAIHGATALVTGAKGENLIGLMNLGAGYRDAPGGVANWSFAGNSNYLAASGSVTINISKATASISVSGFSGVYDGNVHAAQGRATGVSGEDLSAILNLGNSYTDAPGGMANWSFAGNVNYLPASGSVAITILQATITVTGFTGDFDGNSHGASATVVGAGGEDLSSLFSLGGSFVEVPGGMAHWIFTGNANYAAASGSAKIDILAVDASISITSYSTTYNGLSQTAAGTARGILGENLDAYLILSSTVHNNAGTYIDTWSFHDPSGRYKDASGTIVNTIAKATAIITVTPYTAATQIYNAHSRTATGTVIGVDAGGAALGATLDLNGTVHTNAGTYLDSWFFSGGQNYNDASGTITNSIAKATASISITPYTSATTIYNGTAHTVTAVATGVDAGGAALGTSFDLSGTTHTNAGSYVDSWVFLGGTNYFSASGSVSNSIAKANATITVTPYSTTYNGSSHVATATAVGFDAGGAALGTSFDLSSTVHTNAGSSADNWYFAGGTNYNNASGVITNTINKANAIITVTPYTTANTSYNGLSHTSTATAVGFDAGGAALGTSFNLTGTTHTNAGTTTDSWSFSGGQNYNDVSGVVTNSIAKANAIIVVTPYTSTTTTYDTTTHTATAQATGFDAGGAALGTSFNLSGTAHVNAGTTTDTWTFSGGINYNDATGTVTNSIGKANAIITITPYTSASVTYDALSHTAAATATGVDAGGAALGTSFNLAGTVHTNTGTYTDTWTFSGGTNYNDTTGTITDSIAKANAILTVTPYTTSTVTYDAQSHTATASAIGVDAGGAALGTSFNLAGTVHTNAGTYTDTWTFNGGTNYNNATGTITNSIAKATAIITVTPYTSASTVYDGKNHTSAASAVGVDTGSQALGTSFNLFGTRHINAGSTTDTWTFSGGTNYNDATGTVTNSIAKANAIIVVNPYTSIFNGLPQTSTATAQGADAGGLAAGSAFNLTATTRTNVGNTVDTWTFSGGTNYNDASGTVSNSIIKANVSLSLVAGVTVAVSTNDRLTVSALLSGGFAEGGAITFTLTDPNGATAFQQVVTVSGNGTYRPNDFAPEIVGTYQWSAIYTGDSNHNGAQGSASQIAKPSPNLVGFTQYAVGADTGSGAVQYYNTNHVLVSTTTPFGPTWTGGIRVATANFNSDGIDDLVVGTGPGGPSQLKIIDGSTQKVLFSLNPFEASFTGGIFVSTGDLNNDGTPDFVISPDEGGGPRVRIFDGKTFTQVADFFAIDDTNFRGGARTAIGDITGKGYGDLVVAAGFGGGPRIAAFDGLSLRTGNPQKIFGDFFAFEQTLTNGTYIAVGDVNGDGHAEIIAGGGPGGGPRVSIFDGAELLNANPKRIVDFLAGDINNRSGIRVAIKNLDNDPLADLIVGSGSGSGSQLTAYTGKSLLQNPGAPTADEDFTSFPGFTGGVFVG